MHYLTFPAPKAEHPARHADLYVLVLDYGVHGYPAYAQAQQTATPSGPSQNSALLLHNYVLVLAPLGGMLRPETRGRVAPKGGGSISRQHTDCTGVAIMDL